MIEEFSRQAKQLHLDRHFRFLPYQDQATLNYSLGVPNLHWISLKPELVRDPAEVDRLLGIMSAKNPMVGRFVPIPKGADGHYDHDRLVLAIQHGFCIVRWHLTD